MAGQKACLLAVVEMIKIASRGSDPFKGGGTVDHGLFTSIVSYIGTNHNNVHL